MGNKRVQDYLLAIGLTLGITAGAVSGGKMLVDMEQLSNARNAKDKIRNAVVTTETFREMKAGAENAVDLVYDLGLINSKDHAKLDKKIQSEDFAYNNRGKLVDAQTANAWQNAVESENQETGEMITSAMIAGSSLAVAGFMSINIAHKKMNTTEDSAVSKVEEPSM